MPESDTITIPPHLQALADAAYAPLRLLLIEDNPGDCDLFLHMSQPYCVEVITTPDGLTGARLAATGNFDRVFIDLSLPGLNGVEVFRTIKQGFPRQKVIIFSGTFNEETFHKLNHIGFAAMVFKPALYNPEFFADMFGTFGIERKAVQNE